MARDVTGVSSEELEKSRRVLHGFDDTEINAVHVSDEGAIKTDIANLDLGVDIEVGHGKTLKTASGTDNSSGDNEMVAAVADKKIKVVGYVITQVSATKNIVLFRSATTEIWRPAVLQSSGDVTTGANLFVGPDATICETAVNTALNINLGAAVETHWSVCYYEEA